MNGLWFEKKHMEIRWIKVHSFFLLWTTSEKLFSVPLQDNRPPVDQEKKLKFQKVSEKVEMNKCSVVLWYSFNGLFKGACYRKHGKNDSVL